MSKLPFVEKYRPINLDNIVEQSDVIKSIKGILEKKEMLYVCKKIKDLIPTFTYLESEIGKDPDQRNYIVSNAKIESRGFLPEFSLAEGLMELEKGLKIFDQRPFSNI